MQPKHRLSIIITTFCSSLLLVLLMWSMTPQQAHANICDVPATYATIQAAIDDNACTTIHIAAGTYTENLLIERTIALIGAGSSLTFIDGGNTDRVIDFAPSFGLNTMLHLSQLTIQNGNVAGSGGGVRMTLYASASLSDTIFISNTASADGGGFYQRGRFASATINNAQFINNHASSQGGAINSSLSSTTTVTNSIFMHNNAADDGGAIFADKDGSAHSLLTLTQVTMTQNTASDKGGALICLKCDLTLNHALLEANQSQGNGGGIYQTIGAFTINRSAILNNVAGSDGTGNGGGLYMSSPISVAITESRIDHNLANGVSATGRGGGVFYVPSVSNDFMLTASTMLSNTAARGGGFFQQNLVPADPVHTVLNNNCIVGNSATALENDDDYELTAVGNWWGAANGPAGEGAGIGDAVGVTVDFSGFLTQPVATQLGCPTLDVKFAADLSTSTFVEADVMTFAIGLNSDSAGLRTVAQAASTQSSPYTMTLDFGDTPPQTIIGALPYTTTHTYLDDGVYDVAVEVVDRFGRIDTITTTITVTNANPIVTAFSDQTIAFGDPVTVTGTFTDVGILDTFTYQWNFGDGTTATGPITQTHVYAAPGTYTVTLTVTDDDGGSGTDTIVIIVQTPSAVQMQWQVVVEDGSMLMWLMFAFSAISSVTLQTLRKRSRQ